MSSLRSRRIAVHERSVEASSNPVGCEERDNVAEWILIKTEAFSSGCFKTTMYGVESG